MVFATEAIATLKTLAREQSKSEWSIDDVAIWDRPIDDFEVASIYNAGLVGQSLAALFQPQGQNYDLNNNGFSRKVKQCANCDLLGICFDLCRILVLPWTCGNYFRHRRCIH